MLLVELVLKIFGVLIIRIFFLNCCVCLLVYCEVIDELEVVDLKKFLFKMVFFVVFFLFFVFLSSIICILLFSFFLKLGFFFGELCFLL